MMWRFLGLMWHLETSVTIYPWLQQVPLQSRSLPWTSSNAWISRSNVGVVLEDFEPEMKEEYQAEHGPS